MNIQHTWNKLVSVAALSLLLPAMALAAYPAEVFRTGETKCYNIVGLRIPCSGTGQDGAVRSGAPWPEPRFTDNHDGTVTDMLTGLEWMKNAGAVMPWQEAFDYVQTLTTGGHSDWRLPNAVELQSLIDDSRAYPAIHKPNPFRNVWTTGCDKSLTSCQYATSDLWVMHMGNGVVFYENRTEEVFIWPVRSESCGNSSASPTKSFMALNSRNPAPAVVPDNTHDSEFDYHFALGLINGSPLADLNPLLSTGQDLPYDSIQDGAVNWQLALNYIKKLNEESYLGYTDWRLPNKNELRSLTDYSRSFPALPQNHPFIHLQKGAYWSSTTRKGYPYCVMPVSMQYGNVTSVYKWQSLYVWPVRGGLIGSVDAPALCLPRTGQTKCYMDNGAEIACAGTGQDGEVQAGIEWPDPRFTDRGDGTVIDNLTGLLWTKDANLMATRDPGFDAPNDPCSCKGPPVQCWLRTIRNLIARGSFATEPTAPMAEGE
jgi:hypothetical protein